VSTARAALAIFVACGVAVPLIAGAQRAGDRSARIGWLALRAPSPTNAPVRGAFVGAMRDLGYVEGRNLVIEYRDVAGKTERFPALASELAGLKVDVIIAAGGTLSALAAKRATSTIPIVFNAVGDPVADGLVTSLARPDGNVTGVSLRSPELIGKSLELLKQAVPGMTRVAFLRHPDAVPRRGLDDTLKGAEEAARGLGVKLQLVEARGTADFDRAFADMIRVRADALTVMGTPAFSAERRRLAELAVKHRLPAVYSFRDFVEAGGLMSYGADLADLSRRAATYVDKILKGAKPGDLPVEQPTKFELVINLKTARALGLTIPPSLLGRADQVIE